jgi:hypothetical protein
MKKSRMFVGGISTLVMALVLFLSTGCNKNESANSTQPVKPVEVSAVKNSFQDVTSQLDAGGNLYGYLSTEQWLTGLSGIRRGDEPGQEQRH